MKKIGDYLVPESLDEITIKQQLTGERFAKENPDFVLLAMIAGYCNVTIKQIKTLPFHETVKLSEALSFTTVKPSTDPISEFEYKGETYSVLETLLKSESQDFISIVSLGERWDALLYIIAVLAKKKISGKYESLSDYNLDERAKHFEDLPMSIAKRIEFFFAVTGKILSHGYEEQLLSQYNTSIQESLNSMIDTLKKQRGGALYTRLQRVTLRNYLQYLKRGWKSFYSGYKSPVERVSWTTKFRSIFKRKRIKK